MRRHAAALAVVTVLATAGCGAPAGSSGAPARSPAATATSPAATAPAVPFDLMTHCGVDEAKFQGRFYEAVDPVRGDDPALRQEWDNPWQRGTMRAVSAVEAEFRDTAGHVVLFRLRPDATSFKNICS